MTQDGESWRWWGESDQPQNGAAVGGGRHTAVPATDDPLMGQPFGQHRRDPQTPPQRDPFAAVEPFAPASASPVAAAPPAAPPEVLVPPVPPSNDETALIPKAAYYETAIIPKFLEEPQAPPTLRELAERHGLTSASKRPRFGVYVRQIVQYRQFINAYATGRLIASVGQARLGRLWMLLTPVMNALVYFVIFGLVLGTGRGVDNFVAYLSTGFFVYSFTNSVASGAVTSVSGQLGLVRAMQFPRASLPLATVYMELQNFGISVLVLFGIVAANGILPTLQWVWLIPVLLIQTVFNTGLGLVMARAGAKLTDLKQVLPFLLRAWMYTSAVFYPVSVYEALPPVATHILAANPMLVYIELARHALMPSSPMLSSVPQLWMVGGAWAVVLLIGGFIYFWRGEAEYGRG